MKNLIEADNDQAEVGARSTRTVAVTNLFVGMAVGVLTVATAQAGSAGYVVFATATFTVSLGLIWFGIHRAYKR